MNVAFRVDSSLEIGAGHVMRCLTVAKGLRDQRAECVFIARHILPNLRERILEEGFEFRQLAGTASIDTGSCDSPLGASWRDDLVATISAFDDVKFDWLIVDHYLLDRRWEAAIRPYVGRILVLDDLANRPHACDVLLDQNLGRSEKDYESLVDVGTPILAGTGYALVVPKFRDMREHSIIRRRMGDIRHIIISAGGADSTKITPRILRALDNCADVVGIEISVVIGLPGPALDEVKLLAETMRLRVSTYVNVQDMAPLLARADLAIGAAGTSSWERCCLGLPAVVFILADNQREVGQALAAHGCADVLKEDEIGRLCEVVTSLLCDPARVSAMSAAAAQVCDGGGLDRLIAILRSSGRLAS